MEQIFSTYLAWAAPNILAALSTAAIAAWLLAIWRGAPAKKSLMSLTMPIGFACLAIVLISAAAALIGLDPIAPNGTLGIMAGVVSAMLVRPQAA